MEIFPDGASSNTLEQDERTVKRQTAEKKEMAEEPETETGTESENGNEQAETEQNGDGMEPEWDKDSKVLEAAAA